MEVPHTSEIVMPGGTTFGDAPGQSVPRNSVRAVVRAYLKSLGAKSFRHRRHVSHSWAVPGDSK
jgi:hypothetical protein